MPIVKDDTVRFIKLSQVKRTHNISVSTITRLQMADPTFPRLIQLSPRCKLINVDALDAWLLAQSEKAAKPSLRGAAEVARAEAA